jgi:CheY-like chemotaxis protein
MCHALIIDDNMIVSHAIQKCLESLGFMSFDKTWTEEQAVVAADRRSPDLIVIGDEIETGSALQAAQRIAERLAVPVLMVTGDPYRAQRRLERARSFEGPFLLNQIEEAVKLAQAAFASTSSPTGHSPRPRAPEPAFR